MNHKKYIFLDGLRGIAALLVVILHTGKFWGWQPAHGYLAVDLFFLLSGFVIAYAYEGKLSAGLINKRQFVSIRLVRLYPIFFLSLIFSAAIAAGRAILAHYADLLTIPQISVSFILNVFFIPSPIKNNEILFPLNGLYWSLFYELLVNIIYAIVRPVLSTKLLLAIIMGAAFIVFGVATVHGDMNIGFNNDFASVVAAFGRSIFGIFLGVLMFRKKSFFLDYINNVLHVTIKPAFAFLGIVAIMIMPDFSSLNALSDVLAVIFFFPLLVLHCIEGTTKRWGRAMLILGAASYPAYVLQAPFAALAYFGIGKGVVEKHAPFYGMVFLFFLIIASVALEKKFDIPLRQWFSARYIKKSNNSKRTDEQSSS
ncbi:acyltransferase [Robbsia sp. Bb-Pol-6]|uniref:Acyltransferase n=1 Tax=Robbsia betulipollinis TaxID=2981849 RepID=A0ABT3ZTD2_9BURK|nr:acyltransferase [Robbsia betulipollinis]MCY0389811.1 acyltransferase [Robbsia betulipollinis]